MQRIPKVIYQTPAQIQGRELDAMKEIARLSIYADAKKGLAGPTKRRA
jgi:hypothetical protein